VTHRVGEAYLPLGKAIEIRMEHPWSPGNVITAQRHAPGVTARWRDRHPARCQPSRGRRSCPWVSSMSTFSSGTQRASSISFAGPLVPAVGVRPVPKQAGRQGQRPRPPRHLYAECGPAPCCALGFTSNPRRHPLPGAAALSSRTVEARPQVQAGSRRSPPWAAMAQITKISRVMISSDQNG
jgi:hypothetical protein